MATELEDTDTFEGQLPSTESVELEAHTATSEIALLLVDGGETGVPPKKYDIEQQVYVPEFDDYMVTQSVADVSDEQKELDTYGADLKVIVTNTSGSSENYRISLKSFKTI